ncbi:hypothetical protein ACFL14_00405 [Patescibacteria group bacterium]
MEIQEIINAYPDLERTFIEELFSTIIKGEFTCTDSEVDEEKGEVVVGEANDLEKALYTLLEKHSNTTNETARQLRAIELNMVDAPGNFDEIKKNNEIANLRYQTAKRMFWGSVEERLYGLGSSESTGWGIRSDWKIVQMFEGCTCGFCGGEHIAGGIGVISISEGDLPPGLKEILRGVRM